MIFMYAIEVVNLTKKFGDFTAVDNISFSVKKGELFGLLGPNGAGKTTTLNILSTVLKPTSGHAKIAGFDVLKKMNDVRKSIGIVFQDPSLENKLTGRENLEFHAMIYGMPREEMKKRIKEVLELVELTDKADILVEKYSGGMKRRLEIARGLMHRPEVLFLDEPTLGLDAQTKRHIWSYIKKLNKEESVTIILTTHYMEEADYLCDRIAIIDHGKIVAIDTPKRLKDMLGGDVVCVELKKDCDKFIKIIRKIGWIKEIKKFNNSICLTMQKAEEKIPEIISLGQKNGIKILSVNMHKPSLEDVFLHLTGKRIRDVELENSGREIMRRRVGR